LNSITFSFRICRQLNIGIPERTAPRPPQVENFDKVLANDAIRSSVNSHLFSREITTSVSEKKLNNIVYSHNIILYTFGDLSCTHRFEITDLDDWFCRYQFKFRTYFFIFQRRTCRQNLKRAVMCIINLFLHASAGNARCTRVEGVAIVDNIR